MLANNNFLPAYVAWVLGVLARKPVVVWVHGPLQAVLEEAQASSIKRSFLRWLYRRLPHFVFVSNATRESFQSFMKGISATQSTGVVIPNAAPGWEPVAKASAKSDALADPFQLAYIGRLSPEKHPHLLLDVLRILPSQFRLTLVGDGPLREELIQAGADLISIGRLALVGAQPHGPGLYSPWHITLLASRYEGCPMTLLESFAVGVPCVGLPIPALREVLEADAPYLLAKGATAHDLATAVMAVSEIPAQQLTVDMDRVLSRHQLQDFANRWQAVLKQVAWT